MIGAITAGLYGTGAAAAVPGNYYSIATVTLPAGGAAVTFSSIPSSYKHLQIRAVGKASGGDGNINLYVNGETTLNDSKYRRHAFYADGANASATNGSGYGLIPSYFPNTTYFGSFVQDILDYSNTSKYKTTRPLGGQDTNGAGYFLEYSALWMDTAAISTLTYTANASTWASGTTFALYGVL